MPLHDASARGSVGGMTPDQSLAATAVHAWTLNTARAEKVFLGQTDEDLRQEVAPGKNRLVYLWGHLIAVHDAMLPLLGIGPRLHPELDTTFLTEADRSTTGRTMPMTGRVRGTTPSTDRHPPSA